jgi:aspartyl/asparaginyl-tRNA synthetase
LTAEHEEKMVTGLGKSVAITMFPERTSPFWNMKYAGDKLFNKIDIILMGQETIGSAERSTNPVEMRNFFNTISEGGYADKLYELFGKERVTKELDEFLSHSFIPRFGGGIGITRLVRAIQLSQQ